MTFVFFGRDSALHQLVLLTADLVGTIQRGVEVEEVYNHALHGIPQGIVAEPVGRLGLSPLDGLEDQLAILLYFWLQKYFFFFFFCSFWGKSEIMMQ